MAETTAIEWADSTLNIWEGCQETASPACVVCYARERNLRYAPKGATVAPNWGPHAPRREVKSWRATLRKISRMAAWAFAFGRTEPWFVFVNSLSDFWDNQADPKLRAEALAEFRKHPHLTFLLLTKRPQNIVREFNRIVAMTNGPADLSGWPRNAAIGCTVVTQAEADRDLPHLLRAKALLNPAFAFLSMEPLVEIVDLTRVRRFPNEAPNEFMDVLRGTFWTDQTGLPNPDPSWAWPGRVKGVPVAIDWVITGGATDQGKHKAYPTPFDAFRKVRDDCAAAGTAYFHKLNGEWAPRLPASAREMNSPNFRLMADGRWVGRVGKKAAGRELDGRTWDEFPAGRAP